MCRPTQWSYKYYLVADICAFCYSTLQVVHRIDRISVLEHMLPLHEILYLIKMAVFISADPMQQ